LWLWWCSSSMYVMLSDRGRPRELVVVVRKLCMERRSSRSSSVDLKARMTRSCKYTNTTRVSCEVCFFLVLGDECNNFLSVLNVLYARYTVFSYVIIFNPQCGRYIIPGEDKRTVDNKICQPQGGVWEYIYNVLCTWKFT
jgi:hypothetical protein